MARPRPDPSLKELEELEEFDELEADLIAPPPRLRVEAPSAAAMLEHWTVRAQVYSTEIASKLSILAGLFGLSGKRASAGAMHEAKRFRIERTPDTSRPVEVGVAVRLIVATTEWKVDAEISVPNLAAAAQLNWDVGDARIGIEVTGYSGPLGDLLPAPRQLDVSTLVDYIAAFHSIQAQVFGRRGLAFLAPTVLNYEDETGPTTTERRGS